jgi:hypothetical protein
VHCMPEGVVHWQHGGNWGGPGGDVGIDQRGGWSVLVVYRSSNNHCTIVLRGQGHELQRQVRAEGVGAQQLPT